MSLRSRNRALRGHHVRGVLLACVGGLVAGGTLVAGPRDGAFVVEATWPPGRRAVRGAGTS